MTTLNIPSSPSNGDTYTANGVVYTWDGSKWKADSSNVTNLNGGPLAGFRNLLINGNFSIWQRGYDITVPLTGAMDGAAYTADRWIAGQGNVRVRGATPAGPLPDFGWALLFDGQREHDYIAQPVELTRAGQLEPFFPGTTWTFSMYHDGNPDDFGIRAYFGNGGINSTTVDEVIPFGTALTNLGNSRYSHTFTIPSNQVINIAATNFRVELYSKTGAVVTGVRMTGCQLEPGPVATPFEHRPISVELSMCQRYFTKIVGNHLSGVFDGATASRTGYNFPVEMREPPTIISPSGNISVWNGAGTTPGAIVQTFVSNKAVEMKIGNQPGTLISGAAIVYIGSFSPNDFVGLDAEL